MAEDARAMLRRLLLAEYAELRRRLAARLGSPDRAADALQETFLRLERMAPAGPIARPRAYLLRTALNIASNQSATDRRRLSPLDVERLLEIPDAAPDPAQVAEARSELAALQRAIAELPPQRRAIAVAAWLDGRPNQALAEQFGVTLRTIQSELKRALEHCTARLQREPQK
jgi:RNA polymerase sigma-70 factor (ECF subfamily)